MLICIIYGDGTCPPSDDWSSIVVFLTLILAIAGYKAFKTWMQHRYPLPEKDQD